MEGFALPQRAAPAPPASALAHAGPSNAALAFTRRPGRLAGGRERVRFATNREQASAPVASGARPAPPVVPRHLASLVESRAVPRRSVCCCSL